MFWLSLLVLMVLVAAAPGISMYVEHHLQAASPAESDPHPDGPRSAL